MLVVAVLLHRRDLGGSNRLYQSGIYVDVTSKAKLLNYQLTV